MNKLKFIDFILYIYLLSPNTSETIIFICIARPCVNKGSRELLRFVTQSGWMNHAEPFRLQPLTLGLQPRRYKTRLLHRQLSQEFGRKNSVAKVHHVTRCISNIFLSLPSASSFSES